MAQQGCRKKMQLIVHKNLQPSYFDTLSLARDNYRQRHLINVYLLLIHTAPVSQLANITYANTAYRPLVPYLKDYNTG